MPTGAGAPIRWCSCRPLRFAIDLSMPDEALVEWTRRKISALEGLQPAERWFDDLGERLRRESSK